MNLRGARVAVTRPQEQAGAMVSALERAGAQVILMPLIRIVGAKDGAPLRRAAERAAEFDWIVFTSANGVDAFFAAVPAAQTARLRAKIACIGPATAQAVAERGLATTLVSQSHTAEHLVRELSAAGVRGSRVLLPQAAGARPVTAEGLRAAGAELVAVEAYRTVGDAARATELGELCRCGAVDLLTFTASSAVRTFVTSAGTDTGGARVAVIGPVTAETARRLRLRIDIEAPDHTVEGLLAAISATSG